MYTNYTIIILILFAADRPVDESIKNGIILPVLCIGLMRGVKVVDFVGDVTDFAVFDAILIAP